MKIEGPFFLEISIESKVVEKYNDLYGGIELNQQRSFYLWLMKKFDLPNQGNFLDIACGTGGLINLVAQHGLFAVGIDLSIIALMKGKRNNEFIAQGNGENLPFPDNYFDVVTNIGSLEHFGSPERGVSEVTRVLHPNGLAYILVPNTFSLLNTIWYAYRWGATLIDNQPIQRYGSRTDWENLLKKNGLNVIKTIKYERHWPRTKMDWIYYFMNPKAMIRLLVTPFVPLNLAFHFLFICRKNN